MLKKLNAWFNSKKSKSDIFQQKRILIFACGRTGSTLLKDLLHSTGYFKVHGELFNPSNPIQKDPLQYLIDKANQCSNKHFISRMKVYEMESVLLAGISKREFLEKLIEHCWQIIYLTRTNKVKHNLSSYRAHQTAIFHTKVSLPPLSMEIDCFKFKHGILQLLNWEKEERELLDGIPYLELQYELHLENNLAHQLAVKTVLSYLDLPYINAITKHVKVLRGDLSEFITNYDEFVDTMLKCGYQKHLE